MDRGASIRSAGIVEVSRVAVAHSTALIRPGRVIERSRLCIRHARRKHEQHCGQSRFHWSALQRQHCRAQLSTCPRPLSVGANSYSLLPQMAKESASDDDFLKTLEDGVRRVLKAKDAKPNERVAAIAAGAKLLMIRYKISVDEEPNFFK